MSVTRRDFLSSVAMATAMTAILKARAPIDLSIYFTGLALFVRESGKMTVGLLDHGHETIVVARKSDVTASSASTPTARQISDWRARRVLTGNLVYLSGTDLSVTLTGATGPLTSNPLNVFPLKAAATAGAVLLPDWQSKCQRTLSFSAGNFKGVSLVGHAEKCRHENQVWSLIDGAGASAPYGTILSVVQHDVEVTSAEFSLNGGKITVNNSAPILILQVPKSPPATPDKQVAKDCEHYYSLLSGNTPPNRYPQRPKISTACEPLIMVDPVYCPPAEF